ncbi:MAG: adenine deaminase [Clostridia bacterium]|jgi:adenine deaminase|nr:adenine deaminase [Clostridia bacterium]
MFEKYIKAAGGEVKSSLVLKNATYLDVFTAKLRKGDIAIVGEKIVGVGEYSGETEIDCSNLIVLPGYIDGHVHIESSQLSPEEFASLIVPRGTTTIIADPHEITNVCGMAGCEYISKASESVPLDVKLQLPSCVPATPFETSGAILDGKDIEKNIKNDYIFGLGEFMNYPGVVYSDPYVIKKLEAAHAAGKIIDGHAPAIYGHELNAYLCGGISTDHECVTGEEIEEKISKGMYVHIRHGSSTQNLGNAKFMTDANSRRFILCTDDRHAADLKEKGHLDDALRRLVADGADPVRAVICATLNCAECYGLKWRGGIAPFYLADLVAVDDLKNFNAKYVIKSGKLVAKDGAPLFDTSKRYLPESVLNTVHIKELTADDFILKLKGKKAKAMTIEPGGVVTGCEIVEVESKNGDAVVAGTDILKLAVVERHKMTGNIGKALFKGYGFKGGALGITIAHDSHNIILLGDDNGSMAKAANRLKEIGGGMVIVDRENGEIHSLTLDIAGLMSSREADGLQRDSRALIERAHAMGVKREYEAFMSLAFLSLAVIPKLKITDAGLFDVEKFTFTDINA